MTFGELRQKDVINICDGRRLGRPIDLSLNESACVTARIVPAPGGFLSCLKPDREGVSIPWERIRRIGDDVILVELEAQRQLGLIDRYDAPVVAAHPQDPAVCVATLRFQVAPELGQVLLAAEILV